MMRFSSRLVAERAQPLGEALQAGEFMPDAVPLASHGWLTPISLSAPAALAEHSPIRSP
jgi:hypothetical protein